MNDNSAAKICLISRTSVFENTVFSVYADHIADKNGHRVERYLSVVPRCLVDGSIAGVAVLPVDGDRVGLIRVYRHPLGAWSWEAIKGHVEPNEDICSAAVRELQEESGFEVEAADLVDLGAVTPEAGVIQARTRLFTAVVTGKIGGGVDGELGHGELAFFDSREIDNLIAKGEIEDASTVAIIYKQRLNVNSLYVLSDPGDCQEVRCSR